MNSLKFDNITSPERANVAFAVTVRLVDQADNAVPAAHDIGIELAASSGSVSGTTQATILAGTSVVIFTGLIISALVQPAITVRAAVISGDPATAAVSNAFELQAGPPAAIGLSAMPSMVTTGVAAPLTVSLRDASGNLAAATSDTTIQFSPPDKFVGYNSTIILAGASQKVLNDFTLKMGSTATKTSFMATSAGLVSATSTRFAVLSGPPVSMGIYDIGANLAGHPFNVKVAFKDVAGNTTAVRVPTSVAISVSSGTGVLSGTLSIIAPAGTRVIKMRPTYSKAEICNFRYRAAGESLPDVVRLVSVQSPFQTRQVWTSWDDEADAPRGRGAPRYGGAEYKWFGKFDGDTPVMITGTKMATDLAAGTALSVQIVGAGVVGRPFRAIVTFVAFNPYAVASCAPSDLTITLSTPLGTLGGTLTQAVQAGQMCATFNDLTFDRESGTLNASASGLTGASTGIAQVAMLRAYVAGPVIAGSPFSVVVERIDERGNALPVASDSVVTLAAVSSHGAMGGIVHGTMTSGSASVTIAGVTFPSVEDGLLIQATGPGLAAQARLDVLAQPIPFSGANWQELTRRLLFNPAGYQLRDGDQVEITAGTGVNLGVYGIRAQLSDGLQLSSGITALSADVTDGSIAGSIRPLPASLLQISDPPAVRYPGDLFSVDVDLIDSSGSPLAAPADLLVELASRAGTTALEGVTARTLPAGDSSVSFPDLHWDRVETAVIAAYASSVRRGLSKPIIVRARPVTSARDCGRQWKAYPFIVDDPADPQREHVRFKHRQIPPSCGYLSNVQLELSGCGTISNILGDSHFEDLNGTYGLVVSYGNCLADVTAYYRERQYGGVGGPVTVIVQCLLRLFGVPQVGGGIQWSFNVFPGLNPNGYSSSGHTGPLGLYSVPFGSPPAFTATAFLTGDYSPP